MSVENKEHKFPMSSRAYKMLLDEANEKDTTVRPLFRRRAARLVGLREPRFHLSGDRLNRNFVIGVPDRVYVGLCRMSEVLGVPSDAIGELVATAILPEDRLYVRNYSRQQDA
ncbi:hypothetical protein LL998_10900 [Burkholderia ambifaria]|uniref:hypothetical protein n=1 Tax=Burkholderia ambifaria TaxID=152480 RepID=UPI001E6021E9|nr:hypothetical protein [Burkholderia ambifaria]UEP33722.1 hypothetical protein LL998_10900 [Burkholderia ambifaria]